MIRNLDLTALRSLVTVVDTGGVTRAAQQLNLTQSAVSMQLKRLEEALGVNLIDRTGRMMGLTAQGELLVSYARRLLAINDEALARMTAEEFEGEITLGVPADIVYPHTPNILQRFHRAYPRVKLTLISSHTAKLKAQLAAGEVDLILTTEGSAQPDGETLTTQPLIWVGGTGGQAVRQRPLRLAFERSCIFRGWAQRALDEAGIPWEMAVDTRSTRTVEASTSADLAVHAMVESAVGPHLTRLNPEACGLPRLPQTWINMYRRKAAGLPPLDGLADIVRDVYATVHRPKPIVTEGAMAAE
ncbi:MAG: LysR family transcriptional regulator [Pseudomonadota bacterium]